MCAKIEDRKRRRRVEGGSHVGAAAAFQSYRYTLEAAVLFKYLGRFFTTSDNYWPVVVSNLSKSQRKWDRISRILEQ